MIDHGAGTYSNGLPLASMTIADLRQTAARLAALPEIVNEITAAPDVIAALRKNPIAATAPPFGGVRVYEDATLPTGTWHKGKPRGA